MLPRVTSFRFLILIGALFFASASMRAEKPEPSARLELLAEEWERRPGDMKLALLLGRSLRNEGRSAEAKSVVERSLDHVAGRIEEEGESAELHYLLGLGSLFLERNYVARERFQLALSLDPEREEVHLGLVRSLLELGKLSEAREALELAMALFPESDLVKSQLAEAYSRTGDSEAAIPLLEELRVLREEDLEIAHRLLRAYVATGNVEKAAPLFEALADFGAISRGDAALQLFRVYLETGDLRGARVELQKAAELNLSQAALGEAFRLYYSVQAEQAEAEGSYRRAVLFWERANERDPMHEPTLYRLAKAYAALGNHDAALELYLPMLERRPSAPEFYADLSLTLVELDRLEAAARVIRLGLELAAPSRDAAALARLNDARNRLSQAALSSGAPASAD